MHFVLYNDKVSVPAVPRRKNEPAGGNAEPGRTRGRAEDEDAWGGIHSSTRNGTRESPSAGTVPAA